MHRMYRTRKFTRLLLALFAPLFVFAPLTAVQAASGGCATSGLAVTCTFNYTGAPETWTVPDGVTTATFDLYGASGGATGGSIGGLGGRVTATLAVTPNTTYQILVGGWLGFNGGGASGSSAIDNGAVNGGGASDVRTGHFTLDDRLLVAGGGGGPSHSGSGTWWAAGAGGYPSGGAGSQSSNAQGGGGGSQTAGGAGAPGAGNGSLGQGGNGGAGDVNFGGGGGGGGGGYYGGGGGGADYRSGGGAGGGGSSYATPAATNVSYQNGVRQADGQVTISYTLPDTTPPTASPSQSPAADAAGWNNTAVTVSWNWTDSGSGIDPANCTTTSTASGEGAQTLSATCTDLAGNVGSASYPVKVDTTAPTITAASTTNPNANGWYNGDVTVAFLCNDALSGIPVGACPASQTLSGEGTSISSNAQIVSDAAGNTSVPSNVVTVKIDRTPPSVSVTGVTNGASYTLGAVPAAACTTTDALSGVATPATLSASGTGVGSITATCAGAVDKAGNSAAAVSVSYTVGYNFSGFLAPVNNPPTVNTGKAGRAYPVKFQLTDANGAYISSLAAVRSITYQNTSCSAFGSNPTDALETTATGGSSLRYDSTANQYIYNWATPASTGCYTLFLTLDSGQVFPAYFNLQ